MKECHHSSQTWPPVLSVPKPVHLSRQNHFKLVSWGGVQGWSSLPSIHEALDLIPSTSKTKTGVCSSLPPPSLYTCSLNPGTWVEQVWASLSWGVLNIQNKREVGSNPDSKTLPDSHWIRKEHLPCELPFLVF